MKFFKWLKSLFVKEPLVIKSTPVVKPIPKIHEGPKRALIKESYGLQNRPKAPPKPFKRANRYPTPIRTVYVEPQPVKQEDNLLEGIVIGAIISEVFHDHGSSSPPTQPDEVFTGGGGTYDGGGASGDWDSSSNSDSSSDSSSSE